MLDNRSDEEIAAEEMRKLDGHSRTTALGLVFWIGLALLLVLALNFAPAGISGHVAWWLPLGILILVWGAILLYRRRFRAAPEKLSPNVEGRLIEHYARRQRWSVLFVIAMTLTLLAETATTAPWSDRALFASTILIAALSLVLGPGFLDRHYRAANNDELSRALRARAAAIGYLVAAAALVTNYLVQALAPAVLPLAMRLSLAAIVIIPTLYYLIADWRASRDG
ncbi:uncharacterized membrane protein (DUF485 family) [Rhizomicrobium palustre]|uniref:Uncharacterized membrane protein (DUF485 family) n=1 Tax=Rhizomicrobium palustre TaxID=189966 RepID=A0A846N1V9_9PROT|nr:hypothetical protein [Rhizomicrobium palustre]NIK89479.1 uncharacterized membrane protein (DUF485 family) [Rhizomicrobium palustre]